MWWAALIRFLRRRIVLGVIFTFSLLYFIFSYVGKVFTPKTKTPKSFKHKFSQGNHLHNDSMIPIRRRQPFIWRTLQQHNLSNDAPESCRNSVQGRVLIVDDRGFVCPRHVILQSGCCDDAPHTKPQYSCETCKDNNCCAIFEYCVSCCLHPDKVSFFVFIWGYYSFF